MAVRTEAHAALLASAAAWGARAPLRCLVDASGWTSQDPRALLMLRGSSWLRLWLFASDCGSSVPDPAQALAQRELMDAISMLSNLPEMRWDEYPTFWDHVIDAIQEKARAINPTGKDPWSFERQEVGYLDWEDPAHCSPRFVLDFGQCQLTQAKLDWCLAFLSAKSDDVLGPGLRGIIASATPSLPGFQRRTRRIDVAIDLSNCNLNTTMLLHLYDFLGTYATTKEKEGGTEVEYVVSTLILQGCLIDDARMFETLTDIIHIRSSLVQIKHLDLDGCFRALMQVEAVTAFQHFAYAALVDEDSALENVRLLQCQSQFDFFSALFSALRYAPRVRSLQIVNALASSTNRPVPTLMWMWFALAFLHSSTQCAVESLVLPGATLPHTEEEWSPIHNLLASESPARVLLEMTSDLARNAIEQDCSPQTPRAGTLFVHPKRRAKLRPVPKLKASALSSRHCAHNLSLEVVVQLEKWTCVIVPGVGFAWMQAGAIESSTSTQHPSPKRSPLRSLSCWPQPPASQPASNLLPLLELVGAELRTLSIPRVKVTTEADFARILQSCPKLQHFEMPYHFVHQLGGDAVACAATTLKAFNFKMPHVILHEEHRQRPILRPDALSPFLVEIVDRLEASQLVSLTRVSLSLGTENLALVHQLLNAIESRQALEFLEVRHVILPHADVLARLRDLAGQMVGARPRQGMLLALLSVVRHPACRLPALQSLDASLVAIIISFATTPIYRRVPLPFA